MVQWFIACLLITSVLCEATEDKVTADLTKWKIPYSGTWYSGYLNAATDKSKSFHYLFYPSSVDWLNKPVVLWLNGGPGCSSLEGAFHENGPFVFSPGSADWMANPKPWTDFANMLYIESPAGVGFSYGTTTATGDDDVANSNLLAVVSFYVKFNEYVNNQFFIAGESYAGIYIPTLASKIIDYNTKPTESKVTRINLAGIAIGNGCTDESECTDNSETFPMHRFDYMANTNLISQTLYQKLKDNQSNCYGQIPPPDACKALTDEVQKQLASTLNFNPYNIYGYCYNTKITNSEGKEIKQSTNLLNPFGGYKNVGDEPETAPCSDLAGFVQYLQKDTDFIKALHIDTTKSSKWNQCTTLEYKKDPRGSYYLYPKLLKNKVNIYKYSGEIDSVVPITGTVYWLQKLQKEFSLATTDAWRPWFVDGKSSSERQNAGNVWKMDGLTFITFRNAGHMVPTDQRQASYDMMVSLIKGKDLPRQ